MRVQIVLREEVVRELDHRVGPRRRSAFIARAVEQALDDERRGDLIESSLGSSGMETRVGRRPVLVGSAATPPRRAPGRVVGAVLPDTTVLIDLLRGRLEARQQSARAS